MQHLILRRGYHAHYQFTNSLRRPFIDVTYGAVSASMINGLRITSGAFLVGHDAQKSPGQLDRRVRGLSEILDLVSRVEELQWFGTRPCMPDLFPMIGAAPHQAG